MKYRLFISILFFLTLKNVKAQLPDPSNSVIAAKLQAIIRQNQVGLKYQRKQIVEAIRAFQQGLRATKEVKGYHDYIKSLYNDKNDFKLKDLLNPDKLENFILNGDRVDFYFRSTSRQLLNDIYLLSSISKSGNQVIDVGKNLGIIDQSDYNNLVDNKSANIEKIDSQTLAKLKKMRNEIIQLEVNTTRDMEQYFILLMEQAKEFSQMAKNDIRLKPGERKNLTAKANELVIKANEIQDKTIDRNIKISQEIDKKIINKKQDQHLSQYFKRKRKNKKKRRHGFFDSQHINSRDK